MKPAGSDSDSDSEYRSATEAESTTSKLEAVTSAERAQQEAKDHAREAAHVEMERQLAEAKA